MALCPQQCYCPFIIFPAVQYTPPAPLRTIYAKAASRDCRWLLPVILIDLSQAYWLTGLLDSVPAFLAKEYVVRPVARAIEWAFRIPA